MSEPRSPRVADIAAQADVSEATVSRVAQQPPGSIRQSVEAMGMPPRGVVLGIFGGAGYPTAECVFRPEPARLDRRCARPALSHLWRVGGCAPIVDT